MAFFSKENKATVSPLIKAVLGKYGLKGSISIRNHSSLVVTIKSGKLNFMEADRKIQERLCIRDGHVLEIYNRDHLSANQYHTAEGHRKVKENTIADFYDELFTAMRSAGWFDKSDSMSDYFHTAYYMDVNIGKWDKPYILER